GLENSLSVLELIKLLEEFLSRKINYTFADWRPGDQRVFICDIKKAKQDLGWEPNVSVKEGVHKLLTWVLDNKSLFIDTQK
ncbi:MAG TPA: CDP-paratose 2-epimerase, partial [Candidatus Tenderia sp.]|nr:CDP-paratose 2-epimerase [Candidatus Tenderia sp.]